MQSLRKMAEKGRKKSHRMGLWLGHLQTITRTAFLAMGGKRGVGKRLAGYSCAQS
jgi:hypothetical protein